MPGKLPLSALGIMVLCNVAWALNEVVSKIAGRDDRAGLGSEFTLAQFDRDPRHPERHPRPHRIGAAAEGIEDGPA